MSTSKQIGYLAIHPQLTSFSIMGYRKLKADKIFDGYRMVEHHVLITTANGRIEEVVAEKDAGEDIEIFEGILSPGFINCHCHLELSHMKALIPEKTGLNSKN